MQGRRFLTTQWLCDVLTMVDRFDEALQISVQSIAISPARAPGLGSQHLRRPDEGGSCSRWVYFRTRRRRLGDGSHRTWPTRLSASSMLPGSSPSGAWRFIPAIASWHDRPTRLLMRCSIRVRRVSEDMRCGFSRCRQWQMAIRSAHIRWLCTLGQRTRNRLCLDFRWASPTTCTWCALLLQPMTSNWPSTQLTLPIPLGAQPGSRTLEAVAAHATGLLAQSQNDLARAVTLYETGPRPLALASALEDLGVVAVERGFQRTGSTRSIVPSRSTPERAPPGMPVGFGGDFGRWVCVGAWSRRDGRPGLGCNDRF